MSNEKKNSDLKKLVELRKKVKSKKPEFQRQESWRYKRVKENWRKPRGIDSKMRRKIKGWPATVNIGYRGPKMARGLHPSGMKEVLVYNVDDLREIDPKTEAIRVAHTVGARKRSEIFNRAKELGIRILNPGVVIELETEKTAKA